MSNRLHQEAQALSAEAALLLSQGDLLAARALFSRAADQELAALASLPEGRTRTRGIVAVSAASLLYKARRLQEAERTCFRFLGQENLPPFAEIQIREVIDAVSDEFFVETSTHSVYSQQGITLSLRGGEVRVGTAPLDLLIHTTTGFRNLLVRCAEWDGGYEFRTRGGPPREVRDFVQARATEGRAGSYRFDVRLYEPPQTDLFRDPRISASRVVDQVFSLVRGVHQGPSDSLVSLVPDPRWRGALLHLLRAITPSGRRLAEVEMIRIGSRGVEAVTLSPHTRHRIADALAVDSPEGEEPAEFRGVLRALHLDRSWLEIRKEDGKLQRCDAVSHLLDEVVGPMVDRQVVVRGRMNRTASRPRFLVEDIELWEEGDGA